MNLSRSLRKNIDWFFITLIIVIIIFSHGSVFFSASILSNGDWNFLFQETAKAEYLSLIPSWTTYSDGFGAFNINATFYPLNILLGLLVTFFGFSLAERVIYFIPILTVSGIGMYFLAKTVLKNQIGATVASLVFTYNSYFVVTSATHPTIAGAYALSPLVFLLFKKYLNDSKYNYGILTLIFVFLMMSYDFRILYLLFLLMFVYVLFFFIKNALRRKWEINIFLIKKCSLFFLLFFGLSAYWSIGLFSLNAVTNNDLFSRGLWGNNFYNILHAITFHYSFWNPEQYIPFQEVAVPYYYFIFPGLFIIALFLRNKSYEIYFYFLIGLLGILLTKQVGLPLDSLYQFLYQHFPGFNAFREASKFYLITALSYSMIIGFLVSWVINLKFKFFYQRITKNIILVIVMSAICFNLVPLVRGKVARNFVPQQIPNDYLIFKDFILKQPDDFRIFWTPTFSRWSYWDSKHLRLWDAAVIYADWKDLFDFSQNNQVTIQDNLMTVFRQSFSNDLFDLSRIKYVVVPLQDPILSSDFYQSYGGGKNPEIRKWYIDEINKISWLKKIDIGTEDLAVYENLDFQPYVFSFTNLFRFDSFSNLSDKFIFVQNKLNDQFYFLVNTSSNPIQATTSVRDILDSGRTLVFADSKLEVSLDSFGTDVINNIFIEGSFFASLVGDQMVFSLKENGHLILDNREILSDADKKIVKTIKIDGNKKYYLQINNELVPLKESEEIYLGNNTQRQIDIFYTDNNLINNPSFEEGSWLDKVGDCYHFDDRPILSMSLNKNEKTDGIQSLQLEATRHNACVFTKLNASGVGGGDYLLSFDYQSPNAKQASYYLGFYGDQDSFLKEAVSIVDDKWHSYTKKIKIPKNTNIVSLYVYANSIDGQTNIINRYDNFGLAKLNFLQTVLLPKIDDFEKVPMKFKTDDKITFSYFNQDYSFKNLINNPSFEEGSWLDKVGDCFNYDSKPVLSMSLDRDEKTDGTQSLRLEATRHMACVYTKQLLTSGEKYYLSFDYQSPNAKQASYYLGFNDKNKTVFKDDPKIFNSNWASFHKIISAPTDATAANIYLYARATDGRKNIVNRYDNVALIKVPELANHYYLVSDKQESIQEPKKIDFIQVNREKKLVHIEGATTPFFLAMSEAYHDDWQLQLDNSKIHGWLSGWWPGAKPDRIGDDYHYKLNTFLNAWYVDVNDWCVKQNNSACHQNDDGSWDMDLVIQFWPQRWFYLGLLISYATLVGCLGYLGFVGVWWVSDRCNKKKNGLSRLLPLKKMNLFLDRIKRIFLRQ